MPTWARHVCSYWMHACVCIHDHPNNQVCVCMYPFRLLPLPTLPNSHFLPSFFLSFVPACQHDPWGLPSDSDNITTTFFGGNQLIHPPIEPSIPRCKVWPLLIFILDLEHMHPHNSQCYSSVVLMSDFGGVGGGRHIFGHQEWILLARFFFLCCSCVKESGSERRERGEERGRGRYSEAQHVMTRSYRHRCIFFSTLFFDLTCFEVWPAFDLPNNPIDQWNACKHHFWT